MTISGTDGTIKLDSISVDETPTAELRFIIRTDAEHPGVPPRRILQQRWQIVTRTNTGRSFDGEWRDVPLELEE